MAVNIPVKVFWIVTMETSRSSKMLVSSHITTQCHNPEDECYFK